MWHINDKGEHEFSKGKEDWKAAARIAEGCPEFKTDDEDEMIADEPVSCYNCQYRRWTVESFVCYKKG
jgi:hypothetical protein